MVTPYYEDDTITLYNGDCREILPSLAITADLILTDPPYGETSLAWDRWPDGWPTIAAQAANSMWCFGSMRMFLDRRDEFAGWKLSQDVIWSKPRGGVAYPDLPTVTISPTPEGCVAVCTCSWTFRAPSRPTVDVEARKHRAKCAGKERG